MKKIDRKEERRERKERRRNINQTINIIIRDKEVKEGKEKEKLE